MKQATDDSLLTLADHLPAEAAEALLEIATGGKPRVPAAAPPAAKSFDHPDAQRRFRVMSNAAELQAALDLPWEKWTVFLHPEQRQSVEREQAGPARVSGSAGTGKTIVALHRAVHLARKHAKARRLLPTFSDPLVRDGGQPGVDLLDAPGQRSRIPRGGGDGVRRRSHSAAGAGRGGG